MKESNSEGIANCTGPESCGGTARKDGTEALTGVRAGWVLSREIHAPRREPWALRGVDAVEDGGRQHRVCRYREARLDLARSRVTWRLGRLALHIQREGWSLAARAWTRSQPLWSAHRERCAGFPSPMAFSSRPRPVPRWWADTAVATSSCTHARAPDRPLPRTTECVPLGARTSPRQRWR